MKKKSIVCILVAVMIIGIVAILVNLSFQREKENEKNTTNEIDIYIFHYVRRSGFAARAGSVPLRFLFT